MLCMCLYGGEALGRLQCAFVYKGEALGRLRVHLFVRERH